MLELATHSELLRPDVGVIDSATRMRWALETLGAQGLQPEQSIRRARESELLDVHTAAYLRGLAALSCTDGAQLDPELYLDDELWQAARCAAGALLERTQRALANKSRWQFCLSRPGSHHAGPDYALGGCVLNNLAVAATYALRTGTERVAIVDFDAHHGNGTQDIFWRDPRVLCLSIHQYPFYPGSGAAEECGEDDGFGSTLNLPLPDGSGETAFLAAYEKALQATREFEPHLLLFEAGLDGHIADWTSELRLPSETYYTIGKQSRELIHSLNAAALFELGGGYTEFALREGLSALLQVLTA